MQYKQLKVIFLLYILLIIYNVSRKFIYEKNKAFEGIAQAFEEQHIDDKG